MTAPRPGLKKTVPPPHRMRGGHSSALPARVVLRPAMPVAAARGKDERWSRILTEPSILPRGGGVGGDRFGLTPSVVLLTFSYIISNSTPARPCAGKLVQVANVLMHQFAGVHCL